MVDVSVIVPARNAGTTIGRTLAALAAQDLDGEYEVILVDDGSGDDTVSIAEDAGARVMTQSGLGLARRATWARGMRTQLFLAFTDADCFPTPSWLREGLGAMAGADLVQGRVEPDARAPRGPF